MAYTSHGYHVPGTSMVAPGFLMRAACGGIGLCTICSTESVQIRNRNEELLREDQEILDEVLDNTEPGLPKTNDPVNHPSHYTSGKIEVIDFIEDQRLTYYLGNCVKYISRAGKKDPSKTVEDLQKAEFYLKREIEREKGKANS